MKLTRKQLKKLIIEVVREHPGMSQGYEDNQTKMVRRYLIQLGIGESFFDMNEKQVDSLAADLRLMSPSVKKLRDLYDLSVPTDIWQRNKNLGQTPDGSNLQRIGQMMANRPDSDEEEDPAYASQFGSHLDPDTTGYPGDDEILRQQELDDKAMAGGDWYYEKGDDED
jgi:hypothetical protein